MLWRGVWHDRPCPVRLIVVVVRVHSQNMSS
jgi:hypothetical protein